MKLPTYTILLSTAISVAIAAATIAHYGKQPGQSPDALVRRDATCSANQTCPLNVCCSKYGHCGLTDDFCGAGCVSNCARPTPITCNNNETSTKRMIGYYESWADTRSCQRVAVADLNVTGFTHINYGFLLFDPTTFQIASSDSNGTSSFTAFTDLKKNNPGLQTWVSIGGWAFNDPGVTHTAFSDMISCQSNRSKFIEELTRFMGTYTFDGVDIDWEYPASPDRGGRTLDTANLVALAQEMQQAFGDRSGLSMTLPASYFYLQNFDITTLQQYVSFFNVMTYDFHGVWDNTTEGLGPYIRPHTNLTEIGQTLDLLSRSKVSLQKVNLGLAWYGRSFTLKDPNCTTPNGICQFTDAGLPGPCTNVSGTLNLAEIQNIIAANHLTPELDKTAAIKYISWNSTQWVAYDDEETIQMKLAYANSRCLGGAMVWAMDQVNENTACGLAKADRSNSSNNNSTAPWSATYGKSPNCTARGQRIDIERSRRGMPPQLPSCNVLADYYGVPSGSLMKNIDKSCMSLGSTCGPQACRLADIGNFTTCQAMAKLVGHVTVTQFQAWNPNLIGSCANLTAGQKVCIAPPGGWYVMAPPPLAATASSSMSALPISSNMASFSLAPIPSMTYASNTSQLSLTPLVTLSSTSSSTSLQPPASYAPWTNTTTAPSITANAISANRSTRTECHTSTELITVTTIVTVFGSATNITSPSVSFTYNPTSSHSSAPPSTLSAITNATNTTIPTVSGSQTLALLNTAQPVTATALASNTAPAQSTPGPYAQPGVASNCNRFAVASLGDTCEKFVAEYGLNADDFYAWNTALGESGKYCSTLFWADYTYCVDVSG